jgi:hypothetical protein
MFSPVTNVGVLKVEHRIDDIRNFTNPIIRYVCCPVWPLTRKRLSNPIWQISLGFETNPGYKRMKASRSNRGENAGARSFDL